MAIILNIDNAVNSASVCLARDAQLLRLESNELQKDQAAWLHMAIQRIMKEEQLGMKDIDAIAVTIGPGSYTGLRIGLSTAKGLCFALQIPLICINTLELMASTLLREDADFFCPMIDARRMEVFTACYNRKMEALMQPCALVLQVNSFDEWLQTGKVVFSGNGAEKFRKLVDHPNALFNTKTINATAMRHIAENNFGQKKFADVAYAAPFYGKEFYSSTQ
jgi:tRNA threonylcarbamoyladenosine biosynthesis protein TsaB